MMDRLIQAALLLCTISTSSSAEEVHKRHSEISPPLLECRFCRPGIPECISPANQYGCQCDAACVLFEDCCASSFDDIDGLRGQCPTVFSNGLSQYYRCNSVVTDSDKQMQLAVYMISQCPDGWSEAEDVEDEEELVLRDIVSATCSTTTNTFPPVSDFDTGLIFKNEYCALCHRVRLPVLWPTLYFCSGQLTTIIPEQALTPSLLSEFCTSSNYYLPSFQFVGTPPRFCTPYISSCLSEEELTEFNEDIATYEELLNTCQNGHINLVAALSHTNDGLDIFRNEYCALCNGYFEEEIGCYNNVTDMFTIPNFEILVSLLLDPVTETAQVSGKKGTFSSPLVAGCQLQPGTVFNTNANRCLDSVCSFVANEEPTTNNSCRDISNINDNTRINIQNGNVTTSPTANSTEISSTEWNGFEGSGANGNGSNVTCQSVVVIEDMTEYVPINQTFIFYKPLGVITLVITTAPNQLPIVCLDIAAPSIDPQTHELYLKLREFYGGLVFVTAIISVVLCTTIAAIYLLKPMRSVFGVVVINLAITFLVSDVVLILVGHPSYTSANHGLCVFSAISEQLVNVAIFVWLAIFAVDIAVRYHRSANSLQPRSKIRVMIAYLLIGWTIPIVLTIVGIAANFLSQGSLVQYGLQGSCHITHVPSALAFIAIPDLICIVTATVASVVILILLYKMHYSFERKDKWRFALLFIFYMFHILLCFLWTSAMGKRFGSFYKMLFLPVLFLFRSAFFLFMVAFSNKVLNTIYGVFGVNRSKVNPSGGPSMAPDNPHPENEEGLRNGNKLPNWEQSELNAADSSLVYYLENPMLIQFHRHAWQQEENAYSNLS